MATSTAAQMRQWTGPAVLSFGFRPFFFLGALWAVFSMVLWIGMLAGRITIPSAFDPISWHAHAMIFGYLSAIIAGFLLTAIPNWTGQLPVVGWKLGGLVMLWIAGRVAVTFSDWLPALAAALLDLAFLAVLAMVLAREIVAGKNWRNLIVLIPLLALTVGGAMFHWQAAQGEIAAQCSGFRLSLVAVILLISIIGGRIIPSFTHNWLAKRNHAKLPAQPMALFDRLTLLATLGAFALWVPIPDASITGGAFLIIALLHTVRLARWRGLATLSEPLLWVLHAGYAFVPIGAFAMSLSILKPDLIDTPTAQHVWMAGAIGLMTLAVMTRATLGHSGKTLKADLGTLCLYLAIIGSVSARIAGEFTGDLSGQFYMVSGLLWCGTFAGFVIFYGPLLLQKKDRQ